MTTSQRSEDRVPVAVASKLRPIHAWQSAAILIGFPSLYMLNSFTPWSQKLFGSNGHDAWLAFWASVFVLHWASVVAAVFVMRRHGWTLRDVGIALSRRQRLVAVAATLGIGSFAVLAREVFGRLDALGISELVRGWSAQGIPRSAGERVLWILMGVVTAAFCEEFVYRGFGFHALRSRNVRIATALILASLAWIGIHGLGAIFGFVWYVPLAAATGGLLISTRSLIPPIALHSAIHVFVILGS